MKSITIEKQILAKIKTNNIKPLPKIYFKIKDTIIWLLLFISVSAMGLSFGMVIFLFESANDLISNTNNLSILEKIVFSVPFFWILASVVVITIAFVNFRYTRNGYKFTALQFIIISALISSTLGAVTYVLEITRYIDEAASKNINIYNKVVPLNSGAWYDPDNGILSGTVRQKESNSNFALRDREFNLWEVIGENIYIPEGYSFHPGDRIRILGEKIDNYTFKAREIHPWKD